MNIMNYIKITAFPCPWRVYLQRPHRSTTSAKHIWCGQVSSWCCRARISKKKSHVLPTIPALSHQISEQYPPLQPLRIARFNYIPIPASGCTSEVSIHHVISLFCWLLSWYCCVSSIIEANLSNLQAPPCTHTIRCQEKFISVVVVILVTIIWLLCMTTTPMSDDIGREVMMERKYLSFIRDDNDKNRSISPIFHRFHLTIINIKPAALLEWQLLININIKLGCVGGISSSTMINNDDVVHWQSQQQHHIINHQRHQQLAMTVMMTFL